MKAEINKNQKCLNSSQASQYIGVSSRTLTRLRDSGRIEYFKFGRNIRFTEEQLLDFLKEHEMTAFARKGARKEVDMDK